MWHRGLKWRSNFHRPLYATMTALAGTRGQSQGCGKDWKLALLLNKDDSHPRLLTLQHVSSLAEKLAKSSQTYRQVRIYVAMHQPRPRVIGLESECEPASDGKMSRIALNGVLEVELYTRLLGLSYRRVDRESRVGRGPQNPKVVAVQVNGVSH